MGIQILYIKKHVKWYFVKLSSVLKAWGTEHLGGFLGSQVRKSKEGNRNSMTWNFRNNIPNYCEVEWASLIMSLSSFHYLLSFECRLPEVFGTGNVSDFGFFLIWNMCLYNEIPLG